MINKLEDFVAKIFLLLCVVGLSALIYNNFIGVKQNYKYLDCVKYTGFYSNVCPIVRIQDRDKNGDEFVIYCPKYGLYGWFPRQELGEKVKCPKELK